MKTMAAQGFLLRKLIPESLPTWPACKFGKSKHRAWRNKPAKGHQGGKMQVATRLGECTSVDQLESTTPGMIAHVKGTLPQWDIVRQPFLWTMEWIVIHTSSKVHYCIMEAKVALKRYAATSNIKNRHCYTDNGRFGEIIFKNEVQWHGKIISLCKINDHFRNNVAERCIWTLLDQARVIFVHP